MNQYRSCAELLAICAPLVCPSLVPIQAFVYEDGFSYDFIAESFCDSQLLPLIVSQMKRTAAQDLAFELLTMVPHNAQAFLHDQGQPVQAALVGMCEANMLQLCKLGSFYDICPEEVLASTREIHEISLYELSYFEADHEVLGSIAVVRIRGTVFEEKKELKQFVRQVEHAKKNDPVALAETLDIASLNDDAMIWLPHGMIIRSVFEEEWKKQCRHRSIQLVSLPKEGKRSFDLLFQRAQKRGEPLAYRYAELTEKRVEGICSINDGLFQTKRAWGDLIHILCSPDGLENELISSLQFMKQIATIMGLDTAFVAYSSKEGERRAIQQAFSRCGMAVEMRKGTSETRIELRATDLRRRKWPISELCIKQDSIKKDEKGLRLQMQVVLSFARSVALLLERHSGWLPFWLAPVQVRILPLAGSCLQWAREVCADFCAAGIRAEVDDEELSAGGLKLGARLYKALQQKVPIACVIGEQERKKQKVHVRVLHHESLALAASIGDELDLQIDGSTRDSFESQVEACKQMMCSRMPPPRDLGPWILKHHLEEPIQKLVTNRGMRKH